MTYENSLRKSRLKAINKAYEAAHSDAHYRFRAKYNDALRRYGLSMATVTTKNGSTITDLMPHFDHPVEFHLDEELMEAREEFQMAIKLAHEAKVANVRKLPRARLK